MGVEIFFADRFILRCCLGIMYVSLKGSNLLVLMWQNTVAS